LSEITDEALFERLATAILRAANPAYSGLLHPGVNPSGKTIKGPVDGISFVPEADPPHMILVHHTTTARGELSKKWLNNPNADPANGKHGGAAPGDALKAAAVVESERKRQPTLRATLVLTTNKEPTDQLFRDMHVFGAAFGVAIDVWSVSRLA